MQRFEHYVVGTKMYVEFEDVCRGDLIADYF